MIQEQATKRRFSFVSQKTTNKKNPQGAQVKKENTPKMNIFKMTEQIDRTIAKNLNKSAYILVGKSRSGKSTALNWINKVPLKGVTQEGRIVYTVDDSNNDTKIGHGFQSCTIVPNISKKDKDSIVDSAGFGDTVNYVRMIGVSYGLEAIFDHLECAKFILVMAESDLINQDGKSFFESLNHFLKMFRINQIKQRSQRDQIYQSVAMLITCSKQQEKHLSTIKSNGFKLCNQELGQIENIEFMIQLLEELIDANRICAFNQAVQYNSPEQCTIIENMQQKDWKYFKFDQNRRVKFINLPIHEDFKKLPLPDKTQFAENIKKKIESFRQLSKGVHDLIIQQMTASTGQDQQVKEVYEFTKFKQPYDQFYRFLDGYLKQHDYYNSEELIDLKDKMQTVYPRIDNQRLLEEMIKMKRSFEEVNEQQISSNSERVGAIFSSIEKALKCYLQSLARIFVRNKDQNTKLLRLRFILLRSVRELLMLRKVSRNSEIPDLNGIENTTYHTIRGDFANKDDSTKLLKDFVEWFRDNPYERITLSTKSKQNPVSKFIKSRAQAFRIEYILVSNRPRIDNYLNICARSEGEKLNTQICYYRIIRDIKIIHANYEYEEGNIDKSLIYLISAFRIDELHSHFQRKESEDVSRVADQEEQLFLNQENILKDIMNLLLKKKKFHLSLQLALFLNWKDTVCNIYESIIKIENQKNKKLNLQKMTEYADYCFQNLRTQKGIKVYQKVIQSQLTSLKARKKYENNLLTHINNREKYNEEYRNSLDTTTIRNKYYRARLNEVINKIETAVSLYARHRKQMINYSKTQFIQNLSEAHFNIHESPQKSSDSHYSTLLAYEDKQLGVSALEYKNITDYKEKQSHNQKISKINIDEYNIKYFTSELLTLYKQFPKQKFTLLIYTPKLELHHYLITEKYVQVRFQKQLVNDPSNKIRLIKFLKDIIYQNGQNIKTAAQEIFYQFQRQATYKMRQLNQLYEGKLTDIDLIRILKQTQENVSLPVAANKYKSKYPDSSIQIGLIGKIIDSWKVFIESFNETCEETLFATQKTKDDSDNLTFCDF